MERCPEAVAGQLQQSDLRFVVTGGGSWLGQATLSLLEDVFGEETAARVAVFGSRARPLNLPSGRIIKARALCDITALPAGRYSFLHYAFVTKARVADQPLADYARLNREISDLVEAAARRVDTVGFFLPSSGAVYRKDRTLHDVFEENPYGLMKLQDERRFGTLHEEIGCRVTIMRVFNLGGPYINNLESYALSSIIMNVLRGEPVRLRANRLVFRSYVHVMDLVALALADLLAGDGRPREPFDTVGETVVEVGELARHVTDTMGLAEYPIERPALQAGDADRYVGEGSQFSSRARLLGLALKGLQVQIEDSVADLRRRFLSL